MGPVPLNGCQTATPFRCNPRATNPGDAVNAYVPTAYGVEPNLNPKLGQAKPNGLLKVRAPTNTLNAYVPTTYTTTRITDITHRKLTPPLRPTP